MYLRNQRFEKSRDLQDRINHPKTLDDLYERAREHAAHEASVTFVSPTTLMHLIKVNEGFLRLLRLIEDHWEHAQKTQGGSYGDRDLVLWAQALGWHNPKTAELADRARQTT